MGETYHRLHNTGIFARGGGKHIIDCILWVNTGIFGIFARGGENISLIAYSGLIQEFLEFLLGDGENIIDCILWVNTGIFGIFARGGRKHIIDCILGVNTGIFRIFARGGGKHIDCIYTLG